MQYETIKAIIIEINEKIGSDIKLFSSQLMTFVCTNAEDESTEEYTIGNDYDYKVSLTHISFYELGDETDSPNHFFMELSRVKEICLAQDNPEEEPESESEPKTTATSDTSSSATTDDSPTEKSN